MTLPMTLSDRDTEIFARDGALRMTSALDAASLVELARALEGVPLHHAGTRLHGVAALDPFLGTSGPGATKTDSALAWIGITIGVGGLGIRVWSMRVLGRDYTR